MGDDFKKKIKQESSKKFAIPETESANTDTLPPVFSMRYLTQSYCISHCTKDQKAAFADTMKNLSKLTWIQIKGTHRHGFGTEKIAKKAIKTAIPNVVTDDVELLAFRFDGKAPMVGFRERATFHILWFDRDFSLYDH